MSYYIETRVSLETLTGFTIQLTLCPYPCESRRTGVQRAGLDTNTCLGQVVIHGRQVHCPGHMSDGTS